MSFASIISRAQVGIEAPEVRVEVQVAGGLPTLNIVGMPTTAVRESKDRVRAALKSCGYDFPPSRITVNLAPADLPKDGARFDLAIAMGILAASGQIKSALLERAEFYGELSLSGELRPVAGLLPAAAACQKTGRAMVLAKQDTHEAQLISDLRIAACGSLDDVCAQMTATSGPSLIKNQPAATITSRTDVSPFNIPDLRDVQGQEQARRALEIAAAGGHSLLMIGPPGCGKTLLAKRLPGILPTLSESEAMEVACIASVSREGFRPERWGRRPFRAPHHSLTLAAMSGGGAKPVPGEVTLAHNGVLFLDELPEFKRDTLEVLREPIESGEIELSRARYRMRYPAKFQLIAAMNPCPCGMNGQPDALCRCTEEQVQRYQGRISGPLLDRIDMHIHMTRVPTHFLVSAGQSAGHERDGESTSEVRERVIQAQTFRNKRLAKTGAGSLSSAEAADTHAAAELSLSARELISTAAEKLAMTARSVNRTIGVARTIADMDGSDMIEAPHVAEALSYR